MWNRVPIDIFKLQGFKSYVHDWITKPVNLLIGKTLRAKICEEFSHVNSVVYTKMLNQPMSKQWWVSVCEIASHKINQFCVLKPKIGILTYH